MFCPEGRSTNILAKFKPELEALSQSKGVVTKAIKDATHNISFINIPSGAVEGKERFGTASLGALVLFVAWLVVF